MNETTISIELSNNDLVFQKHYESDFLNVLLNALNSYGIETEDIHMFRMRQDIQLCHTPHVFYGCISSDEFKEKHQKHKKGEPDDKK